MSKALQDFELFTISRDVPKAKKEKLMNLITRFVEMSDDLLAGILYHQDTLELLTRDDLNSLVLTARRIKATQILHSNPAKK